MKRFLLGFVLLLLHYAAFSQTRTLTGTVTDSLGKAVMSASIKVSGSATGTVTNDHGQFTLAVANRSVTLEITSAGYAAKVVTADAQTNNISVVLSTDTRQLETIVVTALGITRKARSLTYSTQTVGSDELNTVKNTNVMNSLNGKVAGVQVNRTSGGAGGSVRIVLRGDKSTRNSQPLYVIDGMPIANQIGGPDPGLYNSAPDAGDILSTINPEDIEAINILKGASASALYGSQGSNGVILITTKKGKAGTTKVDFSSNVTFDNVSVLPKLQYNYMQSTPATATAPGSEDSWGAKGAANSGYVKDFFQTGVTFINSISLSSGNEKSSNYLSYSNTDNKGILPTSTFRQNTLSFRQTSKLLNDKLTFDGTFMGSIQNAHNRLTPGVYYSPLTGLYMFPRGLDFNQYKNYEYFSSSRYLNAQNWWNINYDKDQANGGWGGLDYQQNPYWVMNRNPVDNRNQNVYASASLKYQIASWLSIQARGNINNFINEYQRNIYATTQSTLARFNGNLATNRTDKTTIYGDLLLIGDKQLNKDWGFNFTAGASLQNQRGKMLNVLGSPTVPNVFLESALDKATIDIRNYDVNSNQPARKNVHSVFGSVQFNYQNKIFVDFADRNDWSSTLAFTPTEKKGYNYYSAGASAVLSELLTLPKAINFAKLRVSYAQVGNDIAAFSTYPLYTFNMGGIANPPSSTPPSTSVYPNLALKPETNKSFEVGAQLALLNNRLSVDFTWYKSNTYNQYFSGVNLQLTGTTKSDVNAGNIQNTGVEASVSYKVIQSKKISWTTTLNFSHNTNKIVSLFDNGAISGNENSIYGLGSSGGYTKLKQGGSFGDLYGRTVKTDAQGRMIVSSSTHLPTFVDDSLICNPNPKFILGWNNTFNIDRFAISFLIDGKFGGKVLSITEGYLDQLGVSQRTGQARDNGNNVYISNAVDETGKAWSGNVNAKDYYTSIGGKTPAGSLYSFSATAIRMREVSVSYRFPMTGKFVKDIRVGVIGNNLFFFKKDAPFDPEQVSGVNAGGVGIDAFGLPAYRSIGFSFKCTF